MKIEASYILSGQDLLGAVNLLTPTRRDDAYDDPIISSRNASEMVFVAAVLPPRTTPAAGWNAVNGALSSHAEISCNPNSHTVR